MAAIEKVTWRKGAKPRRAPHWKLYSRGRYLGWRRMAAGSPGTWLAKAWNGEKYPQTPLGDFADKPEEERYDAALAEAVKWFQHLDMGGSTEPHTVRAACEGYVDKLRAERSEQAADDAEGFFRRLVYGDRERGYEPDPISTVLLSKLNRQHMSGWRSRVLEHCDGEKSSFNRNVVPVRAALNLALEEGKLASDQAWRKALKPFKAKEGGAGSRRTLYLDRDARRQLVEKASAESKPFFKTLNMLPMRPGEVAALRVDYLKVSQRALEIPSGKSESRISPLTAEAVEHFKTCARGKLPTAWLVSRADGSMWRKEAWRDEIKLAAKKARLPRAVVAYTIRHSVITDLVVNGLDLFTVAKLAGTSVVMIERHYGHLQREHARSALEKLAALA